MCNEAFRRAEIAKIERDMAASGISLGYPEGRPNFAVLESIRITDRVEIVRAAAGSGSAEMVTRRWSWPAPNGKPVFNFRSDGRTIASGRCLIPVDGFYEFGDAPVVETDLFGDAPAPRTSTKAKFSFTHPDGDWLCIAGVWRAHEAVGEAFAMLTCEPGPDVAPHHSRQVVIVAPQDRTAWLDGSADSAAICQPSPAGSLRVTRVR